MKRKITMILACTGLAGAIMFSSCKKENEVSKKDSSLESLIGTATIKGVVYIDNDQTQKTAKDELASGAIVTISYKSSDLAYNPSTKAISYTKTLTTTTGADGKFSFTVDANTENITYKIEALQLTVKYIRFDGVDKNGDPITASNDSYYAKVSSTITAKKGETNYTELNYGKTPQYIIPN